MLKEKPRVKFHYGKENIENIIKKLVIQKLQEYNIKINDANKSNDHTITICCEKAER